MTKTRYASTRMTLTIAALCLGACATAQPVERSADINVFWPQLRTALLTADVDALDDLSLSTTGVPFRFQSLNPENACERRVLKAYLNAKLDHFFERPGGRSFRSVLENTPTLDLKRNPDVYKNAGDEYSIGLSVRFAKNPVDGAWDVVDMLDDIDRVFSFSESAGGPKSC